LSRGSIKKSDNSFQLFFLDDVTAITKIDDNYLIYSLTLIFFKQLNSKSYCCQLESFVMDTYFIYRSIKKKD
jgi:hypothetical protein